MYIGYHLKKKVQFVEIMHFNNKNIIIILIDALRFDKLTAGGYKYNLTPNINKLLKEGTLVKNHFANGCPTSVSFPAIFSSTFPLDYKGYNEGVKNRPKTFAEVFKDNGYDTFGITSAHPSGDHFFYNRGFRIYENLLDFYQWFRQNLKVLLREDLTRYKNKDITKNEMIELLSKNYLNILNSTLKYVNQFEELDVKSKNFNVKKNKSKIIEEIELLKNNPEIVLKKFIEFDYLYYKFLGKKNISNLTRYFLKYKENLRTRINDIINLFPRRKIYEAKEIFQRFKRYFLNENKKPFLAFIHLFDVHESKNFTVKFSFSYIKNLIKLLFIRRFKFGGFVYDLAVMHVDDEIGKFHEYLKKNEILENSIVAITSDHGLKAGFPPRPKTHLRTDLSQQFYEEFIRVPLIFYPKLDRKFDENKLSSHIDFAPTLLDICNLDKNEEFKGKSIFDQNRYSGIVLSENTGSGICDIINKNIYLCLRNKRIKIVYEIESKNIKERDVFDIVKDPNEFNNLVKSNLHETERNEFYNFAKQRLETIYSYV